eukprot:TRINITY_DN7368_c0_g2_i2.p1 TRINITY_DN7368_c0_g2~~TRINITY_DN7368_c0_g2_i2.p1  ORF type:complete len:836 (+),score=169.73 TRINITY_DN7368_c0_g2_i2:118-2625(+)
MADAVKVAVRVRPFNQREIERGAELIIKMQGSSTTIVNPSSGEDRTFSFDFSYWSHDGFRSDEKGFLVPESSQYADQRRVFDELGKDVLDNAYKGYNCSLFAYGQTGSGKSYSMVGYGVNKGIVPISCEEIFKHISRSKTEKIDYQVTFQMLEIYNEEIRDLLIPMAKNPKGGLKIRQHPQLGVQVINLSTVPVASYEEIERRMNEGTHNRTVASTLMNSTSSRAHTVVAITFSQIEKDAKGPGKDKETVSKINLVDLAGSERADSTGATGDRLKEGAAINLSLTMLGNVITALAEKSNNPKKKVHIPYRESKLTQILQDALGGNSKTIMVAALSPADINYEETLSTLRYADRAKQIKNKAVVNVDPQELLIKNLKEENAKLLEQIQSITSGRRMSELVTSGAVSSEETEELKRKLAEMQDVLQENQRVMDKKAKSWQQQLEESRKEREAAEKAAAEDESKRKSVPQLRNLNEDPQLCNMIVHILSEKVTTVGLKNAKTPPLIQLSGVSIKPLHAELKQSGNRYILKAVGDAKVLHNGKPLDCDGEVELRHGDRVLFGANHLYYLNNPIEMKEKNLGEAKASWEDAQEEILREQGFGVQKGKGMVDMSEGEKAKFMLQGELIRVLPLINEANLIAAELGKDMMFEIKILNMFEGKKIRPELRVQMTSHTSNTYWIWTSEKFVNRVYIMREFYQKFIDGEEMNMSQENDPFWDPNEPVLIGVATVYLKSVTYYIEFDDDVDLLDYKGKHEGTLHIKVLPCTDKGVPLIEFDDTEDQYYIEEPEELIGRRLDFIVEISYARGLNPRFSSYCCKYKLQEQLFEVSLQNEIRAREKHHC